MGHTDTGPKSGAATIDFVQFSEDDDVALQALELEDAGGPVGALFVRYGGVVWYGLDTTELVGAGIGLLPPTHACSGRQYPWGDVCTKRTWPGQR